MSAKVSPRVRRLAIQILDLAAFNYEDTPWTLVDIGAHVAPEQRLRLEAVRLAWAANSAVNAVLDSSGQAWSGYHIEFAETAGLLRDGWSPGEPVVRIGNISDNDKENP